MRLKNGLVLLILSLCHSLFAQSTTIVRAAIDVGSGGPKLRVAEVDITTHKINKILLIKQYPVIFHESLSLSPDKSLSSEIMREGLTALKSAIAVANSYGTEGIVIMGASVFRNATNAAQFADAIHSETGLKVHVLDQDLEGKLAFQAALSQKDIHAENLIVWDIGGGSTQLIGANKDGSHFIIGSDEGSGPFRDYIIASIQCRNLKECRSPNPLSSEHARLAEAHASTLAINIDQEFKDKISHPMTEIVGVGSVFGRGILHLMHGKNPFTLEDLSSVATALIGKTDADLGSGDFACIDASNALLVLGFMKGLNIEQMSIVDINNADGAMLYKPFWE